jgi:hypothetical protein
MDQGAIEPNSAYVKVTIKTLHFAMHINCKIQNTVGE